MKIRKMKLHEVPNASKIVGINYSKKYEKSSKLEIQAMFSDYIIKPEYLCAEEEHNILGFAGYMQSWMDYSAYEIFWVNVLPGHQRKGIGTFLVNAILAKIKKKRGAHIVLLTTDKPGFYRNLGFKTLAKFKKTNHLMILKLRK